MKHLTSAEMGVGRSDKGGNWASNCCCEDRTRSQILDLSPLATEVSQKVRGDPATFGINKMPWE